MLPERDMPLESDMEPPDMLEHADNRVTMAAVTMSLNMMESLAGRLKSGGRGLGTDAVPDKDT